MVMCFLFPSYMVALFQTDEKERSYLLKAEKFSSSDIIMTYRCIMVQEPFAVRNVNFNMPKFLEGKS